SVGLADPSLALCLYYHLTKRAANWRPFSFHPYHQQKGHRANDAGEPACRVFRCDHLSPGSRIMPAIIASNGYRQFMRSAIQGMIADETPVTILSRLVQTAGGIGFGIV